MRKRARSKEELVSYDEFFEKGLWFRRKGIPTQDDMPVTPIESLVLNKDLYTGVMICINHPFQKINKVNHALGSC